MSLRADDPLIEVLERNDKYWAGKRVLIVGEINSLQLLPQLIRTQSATVLCDNFETAQGLSAMMGQSLEHKSFAQVQKKHVSVIFGSCHDPRVQEAIGSFDTLVLFLSKTKSLSQDLLWHLRAKLNHESTILLIGSNAIGGKSADSLLRNATKIYKADTARKCTVFCAHSIEETKIPAPKALPDVTYGALHLKQLHGLFSQGQLDCGTAMLLQAVHQDLSAIYQVKAPKMEATDCSDDLRDYPLLLQSPILDLGCGSGIIGLSLAARGCKVILSTDISATALYATEQNAAAHNLESSIKTFACNMLPQPSDLTGQFGQSSALSQGKFQYIITNPPFHQGLNRTTQPTLDMIKQAPNYLSADGALYLVGNTCLHYELPLKEAFTHVITLQSTTKFSVFKAFN